MTGIFFLLLKKWKFLLLVGKWDIIRNAFYLSVRFSLRIHVKIVSQRSAKSRGFSPDDLNVYICAYDLNVYIFEKKDWDIIEIMVGTLFKYGWIMFRT